MLCLIPFYTRAQKGNYMGCLIDDSAYNAIPRKATYLTRDYSIMPTSYSLKQYCPYPRGQGNNGTCTAWATAYAARTIAEAVENKWVNRTQITAEAFSPSFIYARSRDDHENCQSGSFIEKSLAIMKNEGVVKFSRFSDDCVSFVPEALMQEAKQYRIAGYMTLFNFASSYAVKINETKQAISQNKPVIIAIICYNSFLQTGEIWDGSADHYRGYHAVCVIGYDDNKNGGSFQVMNSWGEKWGKEGFAWVSYDDYYKNVNYAYVMDVRGNFFADAKKPEPIQPKPGPFFEQTKSINLKGELHFKLSTGEEMQPLFYSTNTIPYYRMTGEYISGTRYRIYISNDEPAYVYVIGSDLRKSANLVFPPDEKISPALIYRSNTIAIPDEEWYIEMDNNVGTDYVCVLYSAKELPIHDIVRKMKNAPGSFYDKVKTALSTDIVPLQEIRYTSNSIRFSVSGTRKTIVPVIAEITHK